MRERHGTGRRYIQPQDNIRGGLGGALGGSGYSTPAERDPDYNRRGMGVFRPVEAAPDLWGVRSNQPQGYDEYAQSEASSMRGENATLKFGQDTRNPYQDVPQGAAPERLQLFGGDDNSNAGSNAGGYNAAPVDRPQDLFGRTYDDQGSNADYSNADYLQEREAGVMKQRDGPQGRRYIGSGHNMQDLGTSAPIPERHGRGRAKFEEEDSQPIRHDGYGQPADQTRLSSGQGRKAFPVNDTIKGEVLRPVEEAPLQKPPSNEEMKDAIKEWLEEVYGMLVINGKWYDTQLVQHGSSWSIQAISPKGRSLTRDGPTAKGIAEKLSMMQVTELMHFGIRFATKSEREQIIADARANPTYISGGVRGVMDLDEPGCELSNNRRDPEDFSRRFIASGRDHFASTAAPHDHTVSAHSYIREHGYEDGLPRGIGHGKRYIGTRSQMSGGALV